MEHGLLTFYNKFKNIAKYLFGNKINYYLSNRICGERKCYYKYLFNLYALELLLSHILYYILIYYTLTKSNNFFIRCSSPWIIYYSKWHI